MRKSFLILIVLIALGYMPFFGGKKFGKDKWVFRIIAGAVGAGVALWFLVQEFLVIGRV